MSSLLEKASADQMRSSADDLVHADLEQYLHALSGGMVVGIKSSGPVFDRRPGRRLSNSVVRAPALKPLGIRLLRILTACWIVTLIGFWAWWLQPQHRVSWLGFSLNSVLLIYASCVPGYFLVAANRMRVVSSRTPIPNVRVAMVVTKAPSEPWTMVRATLEAMLGQEFPYSFDVWLADEDPTDETQRWCADHGVRISTRRGVDGYHRSTWPRRRRCKEGNLAYFYDHYGYQHYDVVSQLDADHVPSPTYLAEIVRPFADSAVGYVAAPSICDANQSVSWTVRGRLQEEATFHGPQQIGFNQVGTPICIGSHYAVRTAALRQIGGIGPELAEDFSTSYLLNVAGWRGAFAIEAEAHGDGPTNFGSMVTQEFQWSRSLTTVFLGLVPRTVSALGLRSGLDFLFRCGLYPIISMITVGGLALFATSCLFGIPWVSVNLIIFVVFWLALNGWQLIIKALVRSHGLTRPRATPLIGWEAALYVLTRWPFIALGVTAAMVERIVPRSVDFKVTPKGDGGPEPLLMRQLFPALTAGMILLISAVVGWNKLPVIGYVGLALLSALTTAAAAGAVAVLHAVNAYNHGRLRATEAARLVFWPLVATTTLALPTIVLAVAYLARLQSLMFGQLPA